MAEIRFMGGAGSEFFSVEKLMEAKVRSMPKANAETMSNGKNFFTWVSVKCKTEVWITCV